VLRRLLLILVFAVGLTGHSLVAEHSADASVPRHVATRSERVVRSVTAATTVALTRPATSVATYWQGNADALVTLAFSSDGVHFGTPNPRGATRWVSSARTERHTALYCRRLELLRCE
jgi:hypothetical protein